LPEYQGCGRRPKAPWQSVHAWRKSLGSHGWTRLTVRDGEKGPVGIEIVMRRVQTRLERKRTGPEELLVVTRRPLADDSLLEGKSSPDATEQDGRYWGFLHNPSHVMLGMRHEDSCDPLIERGVISSGRSQDIHLATQVP
jgi:hypothetical protein